MTKGKYSKKGTSITHNYCRNPDGKDIGLYCYYGEGSDDFAPCKKLEYTDMKLQCALLEPFSINKAEINMKESRLMRSMNCIS